MDGGNDELGENTDGNVDSNENEHKAGVQRRWHNTVKMHKAFQNWGKRVRHEYDAQARGKEDGEGGKKERGRTELNIGVESGRCRDYIHRSPEAYILARGVVDISIPYHTLPRVVNIRELHPRKRSLYLTLFASSSAPISSARARVHASHTRYPPDFTPARVCARDARGLRNFRENYTGHTIELVALPSPRPCGCGESVVLRLRAILDRLPG
eukprot:1661638-Pleurochrysis_carterae.AAC.1